MHPKLAPHPGAAPRRAQAGLFAIVFAFGCAGPGHDEEADPIGLRVHTAPAPSESERYCAWYADRHRDTLYIGLAAFCSAMREAGSPEGDTRTSGPRWIGRFDLAKERFLSPLSVAPGPRPTGVWDVEASPDGALLFTTFFDHAGRVSRPGDTAEPLLDAGPGLAEMAAGPEGGSVATRYGGGAGAVVILDAAGRTTGAIPLVVHGGLRPAPKTAAWDPGRREIWVNTDLLDAAGNAAGQDARIHARDGRELQHWTEPELQFVHFEPDGRGFLAERRGDALWLRLIPPSTPELPRPEGRSLLLDPAFAGAFDFAQDVRVAPDGSVLVTRWSGAIHRIAPDGRHARVDLPRPHPDGLYYAAFLRGERLCATYCAGVTVVCRNAPRVR